MALVLIPHESGARFVNPALVETVDVIRADDSATNWRLRIQFASGRVEETPSMAKPDAQIYVSELSEVRP